MNSTDWIGNGKEVSELVDRLLLRRTPNDENRLCRAVRELSDEQKLEVVKRLARSNVRLAATVGARGQLGVTQQKEMLDRLLVAGQSNAIKHFIAELFAVRLSVGGILHVLTIRQSLYPQSVHFAAYYLLGTNRAVKPKYRRRLVNLIQATSAHPTEISPGEPCGFE